MRHIATWVALAALALAPAAMAQTQDTTADETYGSLSFSTTADGAAVASVEGCTVYVHGHAMAAATGNVSLMLPASSPGNPVFAVLPFHADASGDFVVGPATLPVNEVDGQPAGSQEFLAYADLDMATPSGDQAVVGGYDVPYHGCAGETVGGTPSPTTAPPTAEVPVFPSGLSVALAAVGGLAAVAALRRRA